MGGDPLSGPRATAPATSFAVELSEPAADIAGAGGVERAVLQLSYDGHALGALQLPVCDGLVPAAVVSDAAAAAFGWALLGRFLARGPYRDAGADRDELHDRIGWEVFQRELWGDPELDQAALYREPRPRRRLERALATVRAGASRRRWVEVEVSLPLRPLRGPCDAVVAVGGAPLTVLSLDRGDALDPAELRAAIASRCGFELCTVAVREGVLGHPAADPASLRRRLARAAERARGRPPAVLSVEAPAGVRTAPGWDRLASLAPPAAVVLARRLGPLGTSASRRAAVPGAAAGALCDAARAAGEPLATSGAAVQRAVYLPELLWLPPRSTTAAPPGQPLVSEPPAPTAAHDRHEFEGLFAAGPDPWAYTTDYEQAKYAETLAMLPPDEPRLTLEVGCAEGHFTVQLAPRVGRLIAADIATTALERAARRCAAHDNVEFAQLDLAADALPEGCDLIVCAELLYFMGDHDGLAAAARKLAEALAPGGHLVAAHAHLLVDDPDAPGYNWDLPYGARRIGEALAGAGGLSLVRGLHTPLYRIELYRRGGGTGEPLIVEAEQPTDPPPRAAGTVHWQGGRPRKAGAARHETKRLPILTYHRVAGAGAEATAPYRVSPDDFAAQIGYLRSAGFHSVTLDQWRAAAQERRALPGRAVAITFDDGYRDFAEQAWPVLRHHGFGALVLLVSDHVGGSNTWDREHGEELPLLDWPTIDRLRAEGVEFGSHGASHRRLGRLPLAEVAREAALSRAALTRRLGAPPAAFAYPWGDADAAIAHLAGACGYTYGLTCRRASARLDTPLLELPRIEIEGGDGLAGFIEKLSGAGA